jgi:hypothetical protein
MSRPSSLLAPEVIPVEGGSLWATCVRRRRRRPAVDGVVGYPRLVHMKTVAKERGSRGSRQGSCASCGSRLGRFLHSSTGSTVLLSRQLDCGLRRTRRDRNRERQSIEFVCFTPSRRRRFRLRVGMHMDTIRPGPIWDRKRPRSRRSFSPPEPLRGSRVEPVPVSAALAHRPHGRPRLERAPREVAP